MLYWFQGWRRKAKRTMLHWWRWNWLISDEALCTLPSVNVWECEVNKIFWNMMSFGFVIIRRWALIKRVKSLPVLSVIIPASNCGENVVRLSSFKWPAFFTLWSSNLLPLSVTNPSSDRAASKMAWNCPDFSTIWNRNPLHWLQLIQFQIVEQNGFKISRLLNKCCNLLHGMWLIQIKVWSYSAFVIS